MTEQARRANIGRAIAAGAALMALATSAGAWAQAVPDDAIPGNVNDFRLERDGTIAPPAPAPVPEPAPPAPAPAPAPVVPPAASEPVPVPTPDLSVAAPTSGAPVRRTDRRFATQRRAPPPAARVDRSPVAEPVAEAPVPVEQTTAVPASPPSEPVAPVAAAPAKPAPAPAPASRNDTSWWPWAALAGLVIAALAFAAVRRRRSDDVLLLTETAETHVAEEPAVIAEQAETFPEQEFPEAIAPEPVARTLPVIDLPPVIGAEPVPDAASDIVPAEAVPVEAVAASRPHLSLTFAPAAASATEAQASVQFVLTVSNLGDAPARRVRMEARMFAMGEDHDAALAAFFAEPLERATPIASTIPAGVSTELRTQVTLPGAAVRPIRHADRVLFVPVVAVNVLYEWDDDAQGQTAMSYVIGRENKPPVAKMAPFRLDQGPRMYREVGHRVHELRRVG